MNYRNELIKAKVSEGVYGLLVAIAFLALAYYNNGSAVWVNIALAALFVVLAIKDFRRARQIRKEA